MKIPHLDPQGNPIGEVEVPDPVKGPVAGPTSQKPTVPHEVAAPTTRPELGRSAHPAPGASMPRRDVDGEVLGLDGEPIANVRLHDQPGYASGGHMGMAIAVVVIVSIVAIMFFYLVFR